MEAHHMHPDQVAMRIMRKQKLDEVAEMVWNNMHNQGNAGAKAYWKMGFIKSYFYFKGFEDDIIIE